MKKRWISLGMVLVMVLTLLGSLSVFAATEETVTVPVQVTSLYNGKNDWENATYTCVLTDGVPAETGILSNGLYSFMYNPSTGQIKKNAQTDEGFFFNDAVVPTVVIPWKIGAFSVTSKEYAPSGTPVTTNYTEKEISISASGYVYIFNTLPDTVTEIAVSEGVETIAPCSFYGIPTTNQEITFKLPSTLKTIDKSAFCAAGSKGAIYKEIVIPDSVTAINGTAFGLTRFTTCTFPAGVTVLSNNVFQNNNKLNELTLKGEITSIEKLAFSGCTQLSTITFEGKNAPSSIAENAFNAVKALTVYYPANGIGYDDDAFRSAFPEGTVFEPFAVKPAVTGIAVTGDPLVGATLTGSYTNFITTDGSNESGSSATWYRADDRDFTQNAEVIKTEPISAGVVSEYTLTDADVGKYIKFAVVPRSDAPESNVGDETAAVLAEQVRIPQTIPTVTLLSPRDGYKVYVGNDIQLAASAVCDNTTITRVEYYANDSLCASSETAPYAATWSGAAVGDYTLFARAYNALGEYGDSAPIQIRVADLSERTEPVWAEKWAYDFNQFTDEAVYDNSTGVTFPGEQPPTISISTGGTVQSAHGLFGREAGDYHLQINSKDGQMTPATLKFDLSNLDAPINNVVAEADVAFSTTNETRYLFGYRTPSLPYRSFAFTNKGTIQYTCAEGTFNFQDESGKDLTYEANRWYHVAVKYDFVNKTAEYYLDGEKLHTVSDVVSSTPDFVSTSEITLYGMHSSSQTGIFYIDNLSVGQEQDSYVTSVLTSPLPGYKLKGSAIQFAGYAKDSTGREISKVEFYANDRLIAEQAGGSYSFSLSDLPCGNYDVYARAISESGEEGVSETVHITVDGIFLPRMYADGMLLQRNKPITIAGTGMDGVAVNALLNGQTASTVVENGNWKLTLPAQSAAKETTLTISTSEGVTTIFQNVAIGELIMCSGQSNMAYTMGSFTNLWGETDKTYEDIRLFVQPETSSSSLKTDIPEGYWTPATPSAANRFSAMGFLTGKDYYLSQGGEVPVGLIKGSVGGSSVNSWVAPGAYDGDPDLAAISARLSTYYNSMIYPWTDYTIGSVLWYQGEADTPLTYNYEKMLTAFIHSWRDAWQDETLPFIVVQLPIFNYMQSYKSARSAVGVRDGQFNVSQTLDRVETVIAIDTGHATGIHPSDKLPLAQRSSLALQHLTNPEDTSLIWKSPSFDHYEIQENQMVLYFKDVADGLQTKDGEAPRGFKIAGDDGKFVDTQVTLSGNTVIVDISGVTGTPKVRYAWEDSPALEGTATTLNLVNSAGLPMAPFRTDRDRYHFKSIDLETFTLYDPVNFTPAVLSVTADPVIQNGRTTITIEARDYDDDVAKVEVYADDLLLGEAVRTDGTDIFTFVWQNPTEGEHRLHAIAVDTAGATSVKQDPSLGTRTITPKKYSVVLRNPSAYQLLPFEDLSGKVITSFDGADGVTAIAEIAEGTACLVIAAYDAEDRLLRMKTEENGRASFTAEELQGASRVSAFLFNNMEEAKPLTPSMEIPRTL